MPRARHREIPPTAGLPLRWRDLLPGPGDLAGRIARQLGTPALQLECSGTAALTVALHTLRRAEPHRTTVVVPAYTCPLVAIAVHRLGLQLRLCDLRAGHYDMDPDCLREACREDTLAVVPTHLAGRVANVGAALDAAHRVGAHVIEDAAQALGARDRGESVGLRGDLGFFSLAAGKGLSIYEGGLLLARDASLRERLRRDSAACVPRRFDWELRRSLELLGLAALYRPAGLGLAYGRPLRRALRRGDPVGAVGDAFAPTIPLHRVGRWRRAVGAHAAVRLPAFLAALAEQAGRRIQRLRRIERLHVYDDPPQAQGTWPFLLLRLPDQRSRDAALERLWTSGLGVSRLFIHALPDYAYLADRVPQAPMPNARDFAARTLTVSNSPWLGDEDFETICRTLERVLG
ncbi:nucleotide sugar aminotransferase [Frateuria sp. Soil773]|uniref:DegT/DnrJ/EryC1/StrS family aminotransferase n=1 Tax=Frateuria sp. Soil773 TaxID=1736407 RepID=UPI0006F69648|nr:DegT/DnrJ/EryC1/StrS family aminotransferase [Frateuria sp. Soil773]KRE88424.1 nucleotide sugar aminotransferase [Frateuria sp. Soil773]